MNLPFIQAFWTELAAWCAWQPTRCQLLEKQKALVCEQISPNRGTGSTLRGLGLQHRTVLDSGPLMLRGRDQSPPLVPRWHREGSTGVPRERASQVGTAILGLVGIGQDRSELVLQLQADVGWAGDIHDL